ncbi:hypothetical protein GR927_22395 [Mycolicibacterium sp. 3033]|nr:hypothetical protein [Mycolicibacterium aurantiacum]
MSISMIRALEPQRVVDSGHDLSRKASMLDGLIGAQVRAANAMRELARPPAGYSGVGEPNGTSTTTRRS